MNNLSKYITYERDDKQASVQAVAKFVAKVDKDIYNANPSLHGRVLKQDILHEIMNIEEVKDKYDNIQKKYEDLLQQIVLCETVADLKNLFLFAVNELNKEKTK